MKNIFFPCILLFIWSNSASSQCEQHIFSMDEESVYSEGSVLTDLCASNLGLEWVLLDSIKKAQYTSHYKRFKAMVQYKSHFSNVLENALKRQTATVSRKDEKTGKTFTSTIFSIEFYYEQQCDFLISTFNEYCITSYVSPTEYIGPIIVLKTGRTILIFFDLDGQNEMELEKIYLICKEKLASSQKLNTKPTPKVCALDEHNPYYGFFTYLDTYSEIDTSLIWAEIPPGDRKRLLEHFDMFDKIIKYETHFSGILENYVSRQYATVELPEERDLLPGDRYNALILEITFYYGYQCDTFLNVVNRFRVTTTGHPTEEGSAVLYDIHDNSVFVFFDNFNFGDTDREKLEMVRQRVMRLTQKK